MILKYILYWLPLPVIAIINAVIREKGYRKFMGERTAHQASTFTALILFSLYLWLLSGMWNIRTSGQAIAMGITWLVMTILFEFVFGHYVMGNPWSKLLHDYNLLKGRIWVLIPVWTAIAPYIVYTLRL